MQTPQEVLRYVAAGKHLSQDEASLVMEGIMTGGWSDAQIGSYLTALHAKGETREELAGSAYVMRSKAFHLPLKNRPVLDIVGSGGDGLQTLNISTLAGLTAAAAGAHVAKHGNRAMTGMFGSADILEALGVNLDISPADAIHGVDENRFSFLFAPVFHLSMKYAIGPRKEIGIPSIFNHLGPLTNPVAAESYLLGVNREDNLNRFTHVLQDLGAAHTLLVHGEDGMDEITLTGPTRVVEQKGGEVTEYIINPGDFGMATVPLEALSLADAESSVRVAKAVLAGNAEQHFSDQVALNAGAGLYAADKAASIADGVKLARETLSSGGTQKLLDQVVAYSHAKRVQHDTGPGPDQP